MNKGIEINVIFGDGTKRNAVITPDSLRLIRRFAAVMLHSFEGTGLNPLDADFSEIIAVTRADHDKLHLVPAAFRKADFRLGQMDMKASIRDMLRDAASNAIDESRTGLTVAADMVEAMEVPNGDA